MADHQPRCGFRSLPSLMQGAVIDPFRPPCPLHWYPRGGIPIDVFWQSGAPPAGVWIPDQGVPGYRGRG